MAKDEDHGFGKKKTGLPVLRQGDVRERVSAEIALTLWL
jgi:hypothetical protein